MPTMTLKNIPEPLYERLKQAAALHRRSLNSEILYCLEEALEPRKRNASELVEKARMVREKTAHYRLDDEELDRARRAGRP
jgi:plasmid stability protein